MRFSVAVVDERDCAVKIERLGRAHLELRGSAGVGRECARASGSVERNERHSRCADDVLEQRVAAEDDKTLERERNALRAVAEIDELTGAARSDPALAGEGHVCSLGRKERQVGVVELEGPQAGNVLDALEPDAADKDAWVGDEDLRVDGRDDLELPRVVAGVEFESKLLPHGSRRGRYRGGSGQKVAPGHPP